MTAVLSTAAARRVFLTLTITRWFPIGLVVGIITLWPLERGLTVPEALSATALMGVTVFLLELPTSGFADAFGRRPVYLTAAVFYVVSGIVFYTATAWWQFALAAVLTGVFRALDSGPLEAWFVDTVHATDPAAEVDGDLATAGALLGGSVGAGAIISGGLVWWHPFVSQSALLLPGMTYIALAVVHLITVAVILEEPPRKAGVESSARRAMASAHEAPMVVRDGLSLLRHNRVLAGLVTVELFWSAGMVVFETFQPIRLAELLGSEAEAGALMGPVAGAGWGVFALGSGLSGLASRRIGVTRTAILARVLNGLGAVVMGLVAGPVALVAAYAVTYTLHGAAGPMHSTLLHREASDRNRATVLSMNSMMAFLAFSVTAVLAGLLAGATSTQVAMMAVGAVSVVGAFFYRPALRAERARAQVGRVAEQATTVT
ncbi:MAG: MFS transporter [Actinomycetota bacterium]|nr:MFS transporter [Actinomycetota bacterium]